VGGARGCRGREALVMLDPSFVGAVLDNIKKGRLTYDDVVAIGHVVLDRLERDKPRPIVKLTTRNRKRRDAVAATSREIRRKK
jgi:hypothetical protein